MTNLTMQRPQPVYESVLHLAHVRALSPDRLVSDLLQQRLQPHYPPPLTIISVEMEILAQIYAALSYYEDHREQMDKAKIERCLECNGFRSCYFLATDKSVALQQP